MTGTKATGVGARALAVREESGVALFGILVLAVTMMMLVFSVILIGSMDASLAASRAAKSSAFYLAEGGLACGVSWLEAQAVPPTGEEVILPFGEVPEEAGDGTYTVSITPDPMNSSLERPEYTILSTGHAGGQSRTLELRVKLQLLTDFLYFTDREHEPGHEAPIWFHSADLIDGPVFTNDQIGIQGDPTFSYEVMSAYGGPGDPNPSHDPLFVYYNGDQFNNIESSLPSNPPHDHPEFMGGYDLGTSFVDYPDHGITYDIADIARDGGIALTGTYEIVLGRPHTVTGEPLYGYVSYRRPGTGAQGWTDVPISSFNGVFYVNGSFSVRGILDGALTLVTNGSIWIDDNIRYRDSDASGPREGCDDVLGLVAGTDIEVTESERNMNDCEIHAAMIALDNCFRAENWNTRPLSGMLTVHGSIIQSYRGAVGTSVVVEGEEVILTGFSKDYHYDWRLREMSPPYFGEFFKAGIYARLRWREITEA